tara:strand:- start:421 stop:705 length:285 start_codon:yes stop_codon:yes gene_type:complete
MQPQQPKTSMSFEQLMGAPKQPRPTKSQQEHGCITAGLLLRPHVRRQFNRAALHGNFTWVETKGFLQSAFDFKGDAHLIESIYDWVQAVSGDDE